MNPIQATLRELCIPSKRGLNPVWCSLLLFQVTEEGQLEAERRHCWVLILCVFSPLFSDGGVRVLPGEVEEELPAYLPSFCHLTQLDLTSTGRTTGTRGQQQDTPPQGQVQERTFTNLWHKDTKMKITFTHPRNSLVDSAISWPGKWNLQLVYFVWELC